MSSPDIRQRVGGPAPATRITVTALGLLAALVGAEHGIGAIVQGPGPPPAPVFESWPDTPAFASLGGEPALTLVPDLLATGVLAVLVSGAVGLWTVRGAGHPRWGSGLIGLAAVLLVCGGGFGPPAVTLAAGVVAARGRHSTGRSVPPVPPVRSVGGLGAAAARLWPWPLLIAVSSLLLLVPGLPVLHLLGVAVGDAAVGVLTLTALASTVAAGVVAVASDRVAGRVTSGQGGGAPLS